VFLFWFCLCNGGFGWSFCGCHPIPQHECEPGLRLKTSYHCNCCAELRCGVAGPFCFVITRRPEPGTPTSVDFALVGVVEADEGSACHYEAPRSGAKNLLSGNGKSRSHASLVMTIKPGFPM